VAYGQQNLIALYDAAQGDLKDKWDVPAPGRMTARPDGSLLVISGDVLVTLKDGKVAPFISEHLDKPAGVAVDAAGQVYVSNRGQLHNVAVFSPSGQYLRGIGKEGGRPRVGRFDPQGMLHPNGITVDAKGRLWVAEQFDAPRRISVWDVKTGASVNEFFGGAHYSAFVWMDPEHPDRVYCDGVEWQVDLDQKTWTAYATPWRPSAPNSPGVPDDSNFRVFTAKNGKQYGFGKGTLFMRDGDRFKPLLSFFWRALKEAELSIATGSKFLDGTFVWMDICHP
jgi:hypothetical protein